MRWRSWSPLGLITAVVALGCGQKVDCQKLCDREAECVGEVSLALGVATPEQIERLSVDDRKLLADRQRQRCHPDCESPTKPSSMHSKWRECLEIKDCDGFAKCVFH